MVSWDIWFFYADFLLRLTPIIISLLRLKMNDSRSINSIFRDALEATQNPTLTESEDLSFLDLEESEPQELIDLLDDFL
jgi:hypothetical protein